MFSELPKGFVDLQSASSQLERDINVMGVVTDLQPATQTRGTDWMCTFALTDSSNNYSEGLKVRFFKPLSELPQIQGTGDVVLLRNVRAKQWSGITLLMSSRSTTWLVYPSPNIPQSMPSGNLNIKYFKDIRAPGSTPSEMRYAIILCNSQDRGSFSAPLASDISDVATTSLSSTNTGMGSRDKSSLIKDIQVRKYYDLVGQVVKIYSNTGRCELYITDYTVNNLLYNHEWGREGEDGLPRDGDEYGHVPQQTKKKWNGPFGKRTLMVTLWAPHNYFVQENVKEYDYVHLRNTHIKQNPEGNIEGGLHTDQRYPERIDVTLVKNNDERAKDVLRRKRDYIADFNKQSKEFVDEVRGQKRKLGENGQKLSKSQQRKKKKEERERTEEEKRQLKMKEVSRQDSILSVVRATNETNKNVRCSHPDIPTRSLSSIISTEQTHAYNTPNGTPITLPFQNIRFRTTVRVVDFFPPTLADFAVKYRESEFDALSDDGNDSETRSDTDTGGNGSDEDNQAGETKWEWRFCLLLEDASSAPQKGKPQDRIKVYVAGQDAECLLKLDAEDLHASPPTLSLLREKLFILWGDLEERKLAARNALRPKDANGAPSAPDNVPRARPFTCCVKEYGVRRWGAERSSGAAGGGEAEGGDGVGGPSRWERRFRMFGTTVV